MNPRQKKFVKLYLSGIPAGRAYEKAGYESVGDVVDQSASQLLRIPKVKDYIKTMNDKIEKSTIKTIEQRKEAFSRIMDRTEIDSPQDAIRAGAELNKMDGAYAPKQLEHKVDSFFENVPEENGLG